MTACEFARRRHAIEAWANREIDRLGGTPPVSSVPKVDELLHAAVAGMARRERNAVEIECIEIIAERLLEVVDADYREMARLVPETGDAQLDARILAEIEQWDRRWAEGAVCRT